MKVIQASRHIEVNTDKERQLQIGNWIKRHVKALPGGQSLDSSNGPANVRWAFTPKLTKQDLIDVLGKDFEKSVYHIEQVFMDSIQLVLSKKELGLLTRFLKARDKFHTDGTSYKVEMQGGKVRIVATTWI